MYSIAVDPSDSRNVYAITRGLGKTVAFRSRDAGATWQAMRPSTSRDMREIHAAGSGILYTAGRFFEELPGGVQRSTDGGVTWQGVLDGSWSLAVDPDRAGTVWAVGELGVWVTRDGGTSWRSAGAAPVRDLTARDLTAIVLDPRRPRTLYAGDGLGVVKTVDGGATWRRADTGVVASQVRSVAPAASNPATIYAATDVGLARSIDGGDRWRLVPNPDLFLRAVVVDPERSETVYVITWDQRRGVLRSTDGGATWRPFGARLPRRGVEDLAFDPSGSSLYAGMSDAGLTSIRVR